MVDTANATTDWLYGHRTKYCGPMLDYSQSMQPNDVSTKILMSALYGIAFGSVVLMPQRREGVELPADGLSETAHLAVSAPGKSRGAPGTTAANRDRWYALDIARIAGVIAVVSEHSGGTFYSEHNTVFATELCLQWLFIVSGVAFMLSKASFGAYLTRYTAVFLFGLTCNVIGDVIARPGWYLDLGNTVFQMSYVAFIVGASVLLWPLRTAMRGEDDPFGGGTALAFGGSFYVADRLLCMLLYNCAFAVCFGLYVVGFDLAPVIALLTNGDGWGEYLVDLGRTFFYMATRILIIPSVSSTTY